MSTELATRPDAAVAKTGLKGIQKAAALLVAIGEQRASEIFKFMGDSEVEALSRSVTAEFENYVKLNKKVSPEVLSAVSNIDDYSKLADTVASHLAVRIPEKQEILALIRSCGLAPGSRCRRKSSR